MVIMVVVVVVVINLTFQLDFIHCHIKILTYLFTYSFDGAEAFLRI
jgi:hypothetical protein